jgi:hypothetical protein
MFFGSCPNCPKIKKNNRDSITFFLQLQIEFLLFALESTTFFYLSSKFQKFIHAFDIVRAYLNSPKTHFGTLVF